MNYQIESLHQIGEEIREIGRENWEAVKYPPLDEFEFANNDDAYLVMEDNNMLRVITARTDDNALAGYVIILVSPLQHHCNNRAGNEIGFYVKPEYRKGRIGINLIRRAAALCKEAGVDAITFSVTPTFDYSKMLEREGFTETERVFIMRI